jgi:hypothetical protein
MVQVDKWLVQPSLQLCSIITEDQQVGKRFAIVGEELLHI